MPHLVVLSLWTYVLVPVALVNWVIALVRGRPAAGLSAWVSRFVRFQTHVYAYVYLVADRYPPFRGWAGTYPVDLAIDTPGPQPRWKTLLRIVLVIPAYVLTTVLQYVLLAVAILGAIFALFMGRYPRGFRDLSAYALRYTAQTWSYLLLLTDRYPTLASGASPRRLRHGATRGGRARRAKGRRARRRATAARARPRRASRRGPTAVRRGSSDPQPEIGRQRSRHDEIRPEVQADQERPRMRRRVRCERTTAGKLLRQIAATAPPSAVPTRPR